MQKPLTVLLLDSLNNSIWSCLFVDVEKLGHVFDKKGESGHFGTFDMLVDRLTRGGACGGDACMSTLDSSDTSSVQLDVIIDSDAKRAVWTTSAASTNALLVTVENVWRKVRFDGPFPQGFLEVRESCKALVFDYRRHCSNISPRGMAADNVQLAGLESDWHCGKLQVPSWSGNLTATTTPLECVEDREPIVITNDIHNANF